MFGSKAFLNKKVIITVLLLPTLLSLLACLLGLSKDLSIWAKTVLSIIYKSYGVVFLFCCYWLYLIITNTIIIMFNNTDNNSFYNVFSLIICIKQCLKRLLFMFLNIFLKQKQNILKNINNKHFKYYLIQIIRLKTL